MIFKRRTVLFLLLAVMTMSSCVVDTIRKGYSVNCTNDTVIMALTKYSDKSPTASNMNFADNNSLGRDTFAVMEREGITIYNSFLISPDSLGTFTTTHLFYDCDSANLYVFRKKVVENHTWDEICREKLYDRIEVTRENLKHDTPFRYTNHSR